MQENPQIIRPSSFLKKTILTGKPTDVEEVCEQVYLKESKSHRENNTEVMGKSRSSGARNS
jgi:hypothetical protein